MIRFSEKLMELLETASNIVVLTGAGMSAASGVPTFRGKDGLWNKYSPHQLANRDAFLRDPDLVWEWYTWRKNLIKKVKPNAGHYALVDMESLFPRFDIITQNVDNLHQAAGTKKITELHGNIMRSKCIDCSYMTDEEELSGLKTAPGRKVPQCPKCGGLIRPDVVWFGEMLPIKAIEDGQNFTAEADVFFSVGTSSTVEPAASLPYVAKANEAYVVEINPESTPLSQVATERIAAGSDVALPQLAMQVENIRK